MFTDDKTSIPALLILRKSLPSLREGEEVLARWSDEGWYYRGNLTFLRLYKNITSNDLRLFVVINYDKQ